MNKLIYIAIFSLLFIGTSCKQQPKIKRTAQGCMAAIIKSDDSLGSIRNHFSEKEPISNSIINYTKALDQLNFSGCPENFRTAFKNHMTAWREMIAVTDKYPEFRGELHDVFNQIETTKDSTEFKKALKQIWDTWAPIEVALNAN